MEIVPEEKREESGNSVEGSDFQQCSNCGRKIPRSARFCRECGTTQTRDAFFLLFAGSILTIIAVICAVRFVQPYSLIINIVVPIVVFVACALILSVLLWR